jgi:arylsulfatase A-like enzyme
LLDKYTEPDRAEDVAKYYAMCSWFDETCGTLLNHLDRKKISKNTLVLYICDNGWAATSTNSNDPHQKLWKRFAQRSKGSPFENGIRTPIMVSWPKKLQAKKSQHFAHAIDLFPTVLAAAKTKAPIEFKGVNLLDEVAVAERKKSSESVTLSTI